MYPAKVVEATASTPVAMGTLLPAVRVNTVCPGVAPAVATGSTVGASSMPPTVSGFTTRYASPRAGTANCSTASRTMGGPLSARETRTFRPPAWALTRDHAVTTARGEIQNPDPRDCPLASRMPTTAPRVASYAGVPQFMFKGAGGATHTPGLHVATQVAIKLLDKGGTSRLSCKSQAVFWVDA